MRSKIAGLWIGKLKVFKYKLGEVNKKKGCRLSRYCFIKSAKDMLSNAGLPKNEIDNLIKRMSNQNDSYYLLD